MTIHLSGETRLFPLIGDPIIYAKSPDVLTRSMQGRGGNAACIPMAVPAGKLDVAMHALSATTNIDGILVTMPHKIDAVAYCATLSETSRLLNTVSMLRRNADGSWHGETLDGLSFVKAQIDHGARVDGGRVLLLGAGGAGSATAVALLAAGAAEVIVHDTDGARATRLVALLNTPRARVGSSDPTGCDVISNATPMGMSATDPMPVDPDLLTATMFVGDVIAGHGVTALIQAARDKGCKTSTGDQMVKAVQEMALAYYGFA